MFENYPKTRITLPKEIQAIYQQHYMSNREGGTAASGLAQKMERWLHKKVADDVEASHNKKTLEIGAGTLNQLRYEQPSHYDIVEPFKELYMNSALLKNVKNVYNDIDEVDLSQKYDRVISVATFEHILDLPKVVAKSCLLLNSTGSLRTSIPNDGTILWGLGWRLTTGIEFRLRYKQDYGIMMRHEHVNTAAEVEEVLNYFYAVNKCQVFGFSKGLAFYRFYESSEPKIEAAKQYLNKYSDKSY